MRAYIIERETREEISCGNCNHGIFDVDEETEEAACEQCGWYVYEDFIVDAEV